MTLTLPSSQLHSLWAKTGDGAQGRHPLLWHLLDVAAVAEVFWNCYVSPQFREQFRQVTGQPDVGQARAWLAWLAAMHDLGKVSPFFQCQGGVWAQHAEDHGMRCVGEHRRQGHEQIGAAALTRVLTGWGTELRVARHWAEAVNVDHGQVPGPAYVQEGAANARAAAYPEYAPVVQEVVDLCREAVGASTNLTLTASPTALLIEVAGVVKFADWLGSCHLFTYVDRPMPVSRYQALARRRAHRAVAIHRVGAWRPPTTAPSFAEQFGQPTPRPMQQTVMDQARQTPLRSLILVEAQMGQGKTEAALGAALEFAMKGATGLYFALPTRATARTMHARVSRWLQRTGLADTVILNSGDWSISPPQVEGNDDDFQLPDRHGEDPAERSEPSLWFRGPHRAMVHKVGVGTVDQVLLAAEPVRYNFARLSGLAGRVVIFDEVHAYDTFMSTIFEEALRWLATLGCPVILLSATLPDSARTCFVNAYRSGLVGHDIADLLPAAAYPAVTVATAERVQVLAVQAPAPYEVILDRLTVSDQPAEDIATAIAIRVEDSTAGCIAVVCNSVDRAIDTARAITRQVPQADVTLFHARFTNADRARITQKVMVELGPAGLTGRNERLRIVVATQVIEQSLDVDFDWMLTEIAPVDLVLQRAGRLHRWATTSRPEWGTAPVLTVVEPTCDANGIPALRDTSYIYSALAPATLLASWHLLRIRNGITVGDDIPHLVRQAYDDINDLILPIPANVWAQALASDADKRRTAGLRGGHVILPAPWARTAWPIKSDGFAENQGGRLRSRDGEGSILVALAWRTPNGLQPVSSPTVVDLHTDPQAWRYSTLTVTQRCLTALVTSSPWDAGVLRHVQLVVLDPTAGQPSYSRDEGLTFD